MCDNLLKVAIVLFSALKNYCMACSTISCHTLLVSLGI